MLLVDAHGHRLPAGKYTVAVTTTINNVRATSAFPLNVGKGVAGTEIALPPGRLGVTHPVELTFSQPVAGNRADRPSIRPGVSGRWTVPTPYLAIFTPSGSGFAPGATETFTDRAVVWIRNRNPTVTAAVKIALERPRGAAAGPARIPAAQLHSAHPGGPESRRPGRGRHEPAAGTFKWRYAQRLGPSNACGPVTVA